MKPRTMIAIIQGKRYSTETATLLAGDDFWEGDPLAGGRAGSIVGTGRNKKRGVSPLILHDYGAFSRLKEGN